MCVQGVGHWRGQSELPDLLPHIPRHKLDRGLHFRHHALGFVDPIQAGLREPFVLRNTAHDANLFADIGCNEPTVAAHAALQIDNVVDLADHTDALGDLLSLRADALELLARRLRCLYELLQAGGGSWGATWTTLVRGVARSLQLLLHVLNPLLRLAGRLRSSPLLGSQRARDGFHQFMLHME
jgi:hypothetical protein